VASRSQKCILQLSTHCALKSPQVPPISTDMMQIVENARHWRSANKWEFQLHWMLFQ